MEPNWTSGLKFNSSDFDFRDAEFETEPGYMTDGTSLLKCPTVLISLSRHVAEL
jgi:hypothetical protein